DKVRVAELLAMYNASVMGSFFLRDARLHRSELMGLSVRNNLELTGARLRGSLDLSDARVGGLLLMRSLESFRDAQRPVRPSGAPVNQNRLAVRGRYLEQGGAPAARVTLRGIRVGSNLELDLGHIRTPIDAEAMDVGGNVFVRAARIGDFTLVNAKVVGGLFFDRSVVGGRLIAD